MSTELRLRDFDISEDTGFVPSSPSLTCLPEYFSRWEALVRNLPALIRERRIREEVHALPTLEFSGETLTSEREWQRAYVLLTFLAQAYIWVEGERGLPDRVPMQDPGCALEGDCRSFWLDSLYHICFKYFVQLEATGHQWINGWKQPPRCVNIYWDK